MTQEQLIAYAEVVFGWIVQALAILGPLWMFAKKYNLAIIDKKAEAEVDHAKAQQTQVSTLESTIAMYMKTVDLLMQRDVTIIDLSMRLAQTEANMKLMKSELTTQISLFETELGKTQNELGIERELREAIQRQLDAERDKSTRSKKKADPQIAAISTTP